MCIYKEVLHISWHKTGECMASERIELSHKFHDALDKYLTIHHSVTHVHIILWQNGASQNMELGVCGSGLMSWGPFY